MAFSRTCSSGRPQISQSSDEPSSQNWKFVGRFTRNARVFMSDRKYEKTAHNHSQRICILHASATCWKAWLRSKSKLNISRLLRFTSFLSQISQYGCSSKAKGNVAGDAVICYMICQPCIFFHRNMYSILQHAVDCTHWAALKSRRKSTNPKSKIQNPKSKLPFFGLPNKERRLNQSKIINPKAIHQHNTTGSWLCWVWEHGVAVSQHLKHKCIWPGRLCTFQEFV